jgi:predicted GH43/DUF377 family glycosyl hydrolase
MPYSKLNILGFLPLVICLFTPIVHPQTEWTRHPDNPVLPSGNMGSWDENFSVVNSVLFHENIHKMWYEGDNGFGYATSVDEINWIKDTLNNPVLLPGPPGSWDEMEIANASVLLIDDTFHLWYSGKDADNDNRIGHAISLDGINWEKDTANPILDLGDPGSWDDHELIHPFVMQDDSLYRMYYNGHDGTTQRILYAYSYDAIEWTRYTTKWMLEPGDPSEWDGIELGPLCVVKYREMFHMFYTGLDQDTTVRIGYATSFDGINWDKDSANPVLDLGISGEWDDAGVGLAYIIAEPDDTLKMWYGGTNKALFQTGYATSKLPVSVKRNEETIPLEFALKQNYPNPFNPSTKIKFDIPDDPGGIEESPVSLRVFNALGNEVAVLVYEQRSPGSYEVEWDANGLPSGVYFYQLSYSGLVETKKMMLIK